jgi:hypothetical protein
MKGSIPVVAVVMMLIGGAFLLSGRGKPVDRIIIDDFNTATGGPYGVRPIEKRYEMQPEGNYATIDEVWKACDVHINTGSKGVQVIDRPTNKVIGFETVRGYLRDSMVPR